jgi:rod shape-determining protein MreC
MKRILEFFILDVREYALLVACCLISLGLFVNKESPSLSAMRKAGVEIFGALETPLTIVSRYTALKSKNDALQEENLILSGDVNRLRNALRENETLRELLTVKQSKPYPLKTARIIERTFHPTHNLLMINLGSADSIAVGMPVINEKGLVGRVTLTAPNYALVQPVINADFRVSVVTEKTGRLGVVNWKGSDETLAQLEHIPVSRDVEIGEKVITTDFSTFANAGVAVGTVEKVDASPGDPFRRITIRLAADFSSADLVFVELKKNDAERGDLRMKEKQMQ